MRTGRESSWHGVDGSTVGVRLPTVLLMSILLVFFCLEARGQTPAPLFLLDTPFDAPMVTKIFSVNTVDGVLTLRADLGEIYSPFFALAAANGNTLYAAGSDNSGTLCATPGCLLLRITLDPASTVPAEIVVVGPMKIGGQALDKITGLTFRSTGDLYAMDQTSDGLYIIDPDTAQAVLLGTADVDIHGGDLTFTADDRLFMWTNLTLGSGIYEVDPVTVQATAFELQPGLDLSGLAALGHSNLMWGVSPAPDALLEIDATLGITGTQIPLTLSGSSFDHKRGDLDSPYCTDDPFCDDANACTSDICTSGGCTREFLNLGQTTCGTGTCQRTAANCLEGVPQTCTAGQPEIELCDGLDNDCDGLVDNQIALPPDISGLSIQPAATPANMDWTPAASATSYDIISGDAGLLHSSRGEFSASEVTCLASGLSASSFNNALNPSPGQILFFLVRPANCAGTASYDSSGPGQAGSRDAGVGGAPGACP